MPKLNKYKIRRIFSISTKVFFASVILAFSLYLLFRNLILEKAILKLSDKLRDKYDVNLRVQEHGFSGLSGIHLGKISLIPSNKDTLIRLNEFNANVRLLSLLTGEIRLKEIEIKEGFIQLVKEGDSSNYNNFFRAQQDSVSSHKNDQANEKLNYSKLAYKLIRKILKQVPNNVSIINFKLLVDDDGMKSEFNMTKMELDNNKIESSIEVNSNDNKQLWKISGYADASNERADVTFFREDSGTVHIPVIDEKFNLKAGFDSIRLQLNGITFKDDVLKVDGFASIKNLLLNHPKISKKDVIIEDAEIYYAYLFGADFISLDSSSTVRFNKIIFHPYFKLEESQNKPWFELSKSSGAVPRMFNKYNFYLNIATEKLNAQDFINSLPNGLFDELKGMQTEGSFTYRLDFAYFNDDPNKLIFNSTLDKDNFKILKYGEANLAKLNGTFVYTPFENGRPVRPLLIGPENPNFTSVDLISPFLKKCILTTEDPSFYYHRGFVTEAFRQSISKNIKTGKFKRGASTISMQLIKNVFLTREKTMARKLQEILLVYILENNFIVPKDRMFEVYLNIIEWGPNVYGIGEASQFYFKKKPIDLTLSECLYLASIIPRPKGFMWRFNSDGTSKPWIERSYRFLTNLMLARQVIMPEDTIGLTPHVNITGLAKKYIYKNDTNVVDTIKPEDDFFDINEQLEPIAN